MNPFRLTSICIGILAAMGTLMLGIVRADTLLPILVLFLAPAAVYFVDFRKRFVVGSILANTAALIAVVITTFDFFQAESEGQLLAIARLLVYLQIILLFQEKTARVYGQLSLLSLLQVVVASALGLTPFFGAALLLYLLHAIVTLLVFHTESESIYYSDILQGTASLDASKRGNKRDTTPTAVFCQVTTEEQSQVKLWGLMKYVALALPTIAIVAVAVFTFVPRFGNNPWRSGLSRTVTQTGFSQKVKLGDFGRLNENHETVMQVSFVDPKTKKSFRLNGEPYLRGSVLTKYINGSWFHHNKHGEGQKEDVETHSSGNYIRQEVTLEPLSEPVIFSIYPVIAIEKIPIKWEIESQQLMRSEGNENSDRLTFSLGTTGIYNQTQSELVPPKGYRESAERIETRSLPTNWRSKLSHTVIRQFSAEAIKDLKPSELNIYNKCKALESYLQFRGGFLYTLNSKPKNPELDPVEDFLVNTKKGHCEYYASALALMLRSVNIPSRVVIGYKGGKWNSIGKFYQFKQSHAHSWVEAYLSRRDLRRIFPNAKPYENGAWLRLDGTPSLEDEQESEAIVSKSTFTDIKDYIGFVWHRYVIGMNRVRQEEAVYGPAVAAVERMMDPVTFSEHIQQNIRSKLERVKAWLGGSWFNWRGGLLAIGLCGIMVFVVIAVRRLIAKILQLTKNLQGSQNTLSEIPFYRQLEEVLKKHGLTRGAGQTQLEFAMSVSGHLNESQETKEVARIPKRITEIFYKVRFGQYELRAQEQQEIENSLAQLAAKL